jgi:hypothetical protein
MADYRKRLAKAAADLEAAGRRRDELIVEASKAGMSRRAVAEAVGLSVGRIQHIVDAQRGRR